MDATTGIHEGNERFRTAVRTADSAAALALYTRDATVLPPNGDAVHGAEEIEKFWATAFENGVTEARPVTLEVIEMGEYSLEVGEYTVLSGVHILDRGKIMVLWHRDDGVWKMHRDTWNSSLPLPAA
jgi:ketosteroid isomerase-like protein